MKFDVDDKNRCRLVCVKFHLNRCRFAAAVAKCLGGSLFWDTVYIAPKLNEGRIAPRNPHRAIGVSRIFRGGDFGNPSEQALRRSGLTVE